VGIRPRCDVFDITIQKQAYPCVVDQQLCPARSARDCYRQRRREIELFFRWIKHHLRLRGFFSACPNEVEVRIWSALYAYLLVAIAKQRLRIPRGLRQILLVISISALKKVPLNQLFRKLHPAEAALIAPILL